MPTNISVPQSSSDSRNNESLLYKDRIENRVKKEKKLIDEINAKFNKKREKVLKTFDMKEASNYLEKERKAFDSFFGRVGKNVAGLESMKKALRKEIQKNALKKFPAFRELAQINSENITNLEHGLLANSVLGDHLRGPLSNSGIFLPDGYREVAPPFNFSEVDAFGGDYGSFSVDDSVSFGDWGILDNDVRYTDSNGFFDDTTFNTAQSNVTIGINYTNSQEGVMDVFVVLSSLGGQIDYFASDNFGPSDACFDIENTIHINVRSEGEELRGVSSQMIDVYKQSEGDDIFDTLTPIAPGKEFTFSFRVGQVHAGQPVEISVVSVFQVYSILAGMDIKITGKVVWKVEHIYVRVQ